MGGQGNHPRRMFAAQVVDERDSAEEEPTSQDPIKESEQDAADAAPDPIQSADSEDENLVVGSQYDSEYELEQFEEYEEFSDNSANVVYMRAGNVTTTPSLTDRPSTPVATTSAPAPPPEPIETVKGCWDSPGRPNGWQQPERWEEMGDAQWSYSIDYGYYHAHSCHTCTNYITHIQMALQENRATLSPAKADQRAYINSMEDVGWARRHAVIEDPHDVAFREQQAMLRRRNQRISHLEDRVMELTHENTNLDWRLMGLASEIEIRDATNEHATEVIAGLRARIDSLTSAQTHFVMENVALQNEIRALHLSLLEARSGPHISEGTADSSDSEEDTAELGPVDPMMIDTPPWVQTPP
ncbi:hypothetical protein DENSPDRAFT_886627 [Dentipellis sp. KUC8613]|nr:hypothetical protein DENSPDRAFT_886627 [Dentipellis sp. KUC8613]